MLAALEATAASLKAAAPSAGLPLTIIPGCEAGSFPITDKGAASQDSLTQFMVESEDVIKAEEKRIVEERKNKQTEDNTSQGAQTASNSSQQVLPDSGLRWGQVTDSNANQVLDNTAQAPKQTHWAPIQADNDMGKRICTSIQQQAVPDNLDNPPISFFEIPDIKCTCGKAMYSAFSFDGKDIREKFCHECQEKAVASALTLHQKHHPTSSVLETANLLANAANIADANAKQHFLEAHAKTQEMRAKVEAHRAKHKCKSWK